MERLASSDDAIRLIPHVTIGRDETQTRRDGAINALLHRHDPQRYKLEDPGRAFRGMTLIEIIVVITILGLIAAAVAVGVIPQLAKAKQDTTP